VALTAVLLIAGIAIAVLLGCLRGFSLAGRRERTHALLQRLEETSGGVRGRTFSKPLPFLRRPGRIADTTPALGRISKNRVAFVGMAVLMGSRSAAFDRRSRTLLMPYRVSKAGGASNFNARGT